MGDKLIELRFAVIHSRQWSSVQRELLDKVIVGDTFNTIVETIIQKDKNLKALVIMIIGVLSQNEANLEESMSEIPTEEELEEVLGAIFDCLD